MKKVIFLALALMLVMAGSAFAGIADTDHDLSSGSAGAYATASITQICKVCHVPHNAGTIAPLWSHENSVATAYTTYDTATMNVAQPTAISSVSLACLGCHDGQVALENFAGTTTGTTVLTTAANLGTDLSDDHPISISYDDCADCEMIALATAQADTGIQLFGATTDTVECASCHKVHDNTLTPFLRSTVDGSALCLKCHNK